MAFKQELEEALGKIQDEAYRNEVRAVLEKNPDFASGWLRQNDYDRNMNHIKSKEKEWTDWHDKQENYYQKKNVEIKEVEDKYTAAEARIKELETKLETANLSYGDEAAMAAEVTRLKTALEEVRQAVVGKTLLTKEEYERDIQKRAAEYSGWTFDQTYKMIDLDRRHEKTFGHPLTDQERRELYQYAEKEGIADPAKAYESKYSTELRTVWEQTKEKEIKERLEKEWATNHGVPISATPPPIGAVERMIRGDKPQGLPDNADLNARAAAAAAALRQEGKY